MDHELQRAWRLALIGAQGVGNRFADEEQLPKLPLPTLADSGRRLLEWCAPLLNQAEMAETERAVARMLAPGSGAHEAQRRLERRAARSEVGSWLDEFWATRYLGRRDRIALNANVFVLLPDDGESQFGRAATLIGAALRYKRRIDSENVARDVVRGQALSMAQYQHIFSTTRIPGISQDSVRTPHSEGWPGPSRERHIIVFVDGNLFRLDVVDDFGRPHSRADIEAGLAAVVSQARQVGCGQSLGSLTAQPRADWALTRGRLIQLASKNGRFLDVVERALFCVCLEPLTPVDAREACELLLHGDSANRWFDKALSFVVFADGRAGLNVEHSCLDGVTISGLVDGLASEMDGSARHGQHRRVVTARAPMLLDFVLDDTVRADIDHALISFASQAAATVTTMMSVSELGRDRVMTLGVSPDALAQMAFQLAHYRARGVVGSTYESIATRWFQHGRTEAMRVGTPESIRFVNLMDDGRSSPLARQAALKAASEAHVRRVRQCQRGEVPEQHLWALQIAQQRHGLSDKGGWLDLFESPGWLKMRDDSLSTSSTTSRTRIVAGFGPTGARCIGVSYMFGDDFRAFLSARAGVADDLNLFAEELSRALGDMSALLESGDEFQHLTSVDGAEA